MLRLLLRETESLDETKRRLTPGDLSSVSYGRAESASRSDPEQIGRLGSVRSG